MFNHTVKPGMAIILVICGMTSLSSCVTDDSFNRSRQGAVIGAVAGAAIGSQSSDRNGALYGGIAGALLGSAVGNYMDTQQREIEDLLENEISDQRIEIQRLQDETLKVSLNESSSFDSDSYRVKPPFIPTLNKLGTLMEKYDQTSLQIIGHTDSLGSDRYNDRLSTQRAISVARYIRDSGLSQRRLKVEGRGEFEPRESNRTREGRRANRRVEIYIIPTVENARSSDGLVTTSIY